MNKNIFFLLLFCFALSDLVFSQSEDTITIKHVEAYEWNFKNYLIPVSYTHLDVYKRQHYKQVKIKIDKKLWNKMLKYAIPLLILGLSGILNNNIDRILLKNLLPPEIALHQMGVYLSLIHI